MKQYLPISVIAHSEFSKKMIDLILLRVRLYTEQINGRQPQTNDNRVTLLIA